jgi:hypothetical protein
MVRAKTDIQTLPLISEQIERIQSVEDGPKVLVANTSEARYTMSSDGRRWIRKRQVDTCFEPLLSEALSWLLARELKVPVPAGAVTGEGDDLSWLSEYIPSVVHWHPDLVHYIVNLDDLGRMLALDAIIHNSDRHGGNILLQPAPTELELKV